MIRRILVVILLTGMAGAYAQENTVSPYSFYALGDVKFKGTIENRSMAGLSVYTDSIHLNLTNPAAYGGLKLTTYTAALSYNHVSLKSDNNREGAYTVSFDYLGLGFPVSKRMGVGIGLMPYTAVGYRLETVDDSQPPAVTTRYSGEGGLNRLYFSLGYAITKELSIGLTGNYNFGKLQNESLSIIEDVQLATRERNRSHVNGMDFNFALHYNKYLGDNGLSLRLLLLYDPEAHISSENFRTISTVAISSSGIETTQDSEDIDLNALNLRNTEVTLPYSAAFEAGLGKSKKWFAGIGYKFQNTSKFSNPFTDGGNFAYENAYRISVGGFFIPKHDSFTNYWNRVVYRAGIRYEKTGLRVNDTPVNDFGMSFGVGLPLGGYVPNTNTLAFAGLFSNINVGFDIGKRGTTDLGIQENYFNLNISFSLNDKWFVKRKYN